MIKVRFLRKREVSGRLYCEGVETFLETDSLALRLAELGDVVILSRDIVLEPLSVSQTLGSTKA